MITAPAGLGGLVTPLPFPLELPVLPTPRERALLVLMNPDASVQAFAAVIEGDPALTAAVLRAANSAMSSPRRPIVSAAEGVVRLGTSAVKHLITTTLVRSQFATIEAAGVDADELWRHLLACAVLCEEVARRDGDEDEMETAFTAGLMHDLGRLAMAAQAPTRYRQVVDAAQEGIDACEAERRLFGIDHAEFGQRICERWRLPDAVALAAGTHHRDMVPADAAAVDLGRLALARGLVAGMGIGDGVGRPEKRDATVEDHPLIVALGGRARFMSSVHWFRDSTHGRRRAA